MLAAIDHAELMLAALAADPTDDPDPELRGIRETFQDLLTRGYSPQLALTLALRMELAPEAARLLVARAQ